MSRPTFIRPGDGDPRHGTPNGYTNLQCRCPDCACGYRVARKRRTPVVEAVRSVRPTCRTYGCASPTSGGEWCPTHAAVIARRRALALQ